MCRLWLNVCFCDDSDLGFNVLFVRVCSGSRYNGRAVMMMKSLFFIVPIIDRYLYWQILQGKTPQITEEWRLEVHPKQPRRCLCQDITATFVTPPTLFTLQSPYNYSCNNKPLEGDTDTVSKLREGVNCYKCQSLLLCFTLPLLFFVVPFPFPLHLFHLLLSSLHLSSLSWFPSPLHSLHLFSLHHLLSLIHLMFFPCSSPFSSFPLCHLPFLVSLHITFFFLYLHPLSSHLVSRTSFICSLSLIFHITLSHLPLRFYFF